MVEIPVVVLYNKNPCFIIHRFHSKYMRKKKTFLISGGAGFVGSHLTDALLQQGHSVVIIDDFSNGTRENLRQHRGDTQLRVIRGDIAWPMTRLKRTLHGFHFDGIFHLACHPRSLSLRNPHRDLEVNALGTLQLLELAKLHHCKLVFTSNSGIAGNPVYLPTDERHPDQPSTPYDANKLVGEYYCRIYHRIHGVPVGIVRFAAVYGERQRTKPGWKPLIAEFVDKVSKDQRPTIHWDGRQTRDFLYVKDAVQGVLKAFYGTTGDDFYLISTNTETSVNQLFATVCKVLGKKITAIQKPKVPGDIRRMQLSYRKARRTFGYQPKYSLEQGVRNYVDWVGLSNPRQTRRRKGST